jgi:hypothetical protein
MAKHRAGNQGKEKFDPKIKGVLSKKAGSGIAAVRLSCMVYQRKLWKKMVGRVRLFCNKKNVRREGKIKEETEHDA